MEIIDDQAMELGQLYRSSAVQGAAFNLPPACRPDQWKGQPGTRAPHFWVSSGEARISTLDLFQHGWVLMSEDETWISMASQIEAKFPKAKIGSVLVGEDVKFEREETFRDEFGVGHHGATLIRPDGYIAWRTMHMPSNSDQSLIEVFCKTCAAF